MNPETDEKSEVWTTDVEKLFAGELSCRFTWTSIAAPVQITFVVATVQRQFCSGFAFFGSPDCIEAGYMKLREFELPILGFLIRDFSTLSHPCIFFLLTLCLLWSSFFFLSLPWFFPPLICSYCRKFPTANLLGFNLWGRGVVTRKCTPRKTGTVLEPCWKPCWNSLWNLTSVEPCWNLGGALLKLRWKLAGIAGALQEHGETLLEPCGNPVAGTAGWNIFLWTTACVDIVFLALLNVPGCDVGSLAWTLSEQFCSLAGTYTKTKTTSASS